MKYILKKIFLSILTLLFVSIIVFLTFQVLPGNPVIMKLGIEQIDNEVLKDNLLNTYNLNEPAITRYILWFKGLLKGDFGTSYLYPNFSVNDLILSRMGITLKIAFFTVFYTVIISIPTTIFMVFYKNSKITKIINFLVILSISMPIFWISILLILVFSIWLGLFSVSSGSSIFLPVLSLTIPSVGLIIKYLYSSISKEVNEDYVILAKSKGVSYLKILYIHVLKNSLIPVITILGMIIMSVLTGSVIVENVFSISGLGSLMILAIKGYDYPLIQGLVIYYSLIVVVASVLVDMLYIIVDKRIVT